MSNPIRSEYTTSTISRYQLWVMSVVVSIIWATVGSGNVFADDRYSLSRDSSFAAEDRTFAIDDTLYMRIVASDLDVTSIVTNQFSVRPQGLGAPVFGTLQNNFDGTFTAALALSLLEGETSSWVWEAALIDGSGREFSSDVNIRISGLTSELETFDIVGWITGITATELVVGESRIGIDDSTKVLAPNGAALQLADLQVGQKILAQVQRNQDESLRAALIRLEGIGGGELKVSGLNEVLSDTSLTVCGFSFLFDANTLVLSRNQSQLSRGDIMPNTAVAVTGQPRVGGQWYATGIRLLTDEEEQEGSGKGAGDADCETELFGAVESADSISFNIAGLRIEVDEDTDYDGFDSLADLTQGREANVEIEAQGDSSLLALEIEIEEEDDADEIEISGSITQITEVSVEVGQVVFQIVDSTEIKQDEGQLLSADQLYSGLSVEVKGRREADGSITALRIEIEAELDTELEVKGFIEQRIDSLLQVSDIWIRITPNTIIESDDHGVIATDDIEAGWFLEADVLAGLDSVLVAETIEFEDRYGEEKVEARGAIDSLATNTLLVSGFLFSVDVNTMVKDDNGLPVIFSSLQDGQIVKVKGREQPGGILLATEIQLKDRLYAEGKIHGPVTAISEQAVAVAGLDLRIIPQTELDGLGDASELAVGQWLKVHYRVLPDSSRLALKIEAEDNPDEVVKFSGTIEALTATALHVDGIMVHVTDTTEIRQDSLVSLQDLTVGSTASVEAFLDIGGLLTASEIEIKEVKVVASTIDSVETTSGKQYRQAGTISIANQSVAYNQQTLIVGHNNIALSTADILPGAFIEVVSFASLGSSGGALPVAQRIEVQQPGSPTASGAESEDVVPATFTLDQNYPNPFNPSTTIQFTLNVQSSIVVQVFNMLGQEVNTLVSQTLTPGTYQFVWDGRDASGQSVASGMYLYQLRAGSQVQSRKMILVK